MILFFLSIVGDHSVWLATGQLPEGELCSMFGFFLAAFGMIQSCIVLFTAISAFSLMVRERELRYGKYDWRLFLPSVGGPVISGVFIAGFGLYGRSEVW